MLLSRLVKLSQIIVDNNMCSGNIGDKIIDDSGVGGEYARFTDAREELIQKSVGAAPPPPAFQPQQYRSSQPPIFWLANATELHRMYFNLEDHSTNLAP